MEGLLAEEGPQDWSERAISAERKRAEQAAQDARAQMLEAREQEEKNGADVAAVALDAVMASSDERIKELEDRLAELDRLSLKALTEAQEDLDQIRRNANRSKDGRNIFKAADGNIYDEDGILVAHDDIDWAAWKEDGATLDQFTAALRLLRERTEFRRDVLETQERLEDDDLTEEELENLEGELDELESRAPESNADAFGRAQADARTASMRTTSAAKAIDGASDAGPSLGEPFLAAASGNDVPSEHHAADIAADPSTHSRLLDDFVTPHKLG